MARWRVGAMARWGRTTDVEYIYRGFLEAGGEMPHARIQTKNHKEIDFDGRYFGTHPILAPVTDNNMVAANVESAIRYQIAPVEADLTHATRESVMDSHPVTWTVMEKELVRERKLRASGAVDGQKISDPRNYLYMDVRSTLRDATLDFLVRVRGEQKWRSCSIGRPDYEIARNGWVRTTIELPPGADPATLTGFDYEGDAAEINLRLVSTSGQTVTFGVSHFTATAYFAYRSNHQSITRCQPARSLTSRPDAGAYCLRSGPANIPTMLISCMRSSGWSDRRNGSPVRQFT